MKGERGAFLAPDANCGLEAVVSNKQKFEALYDIQKDDKGKEIVLGEGNYAAVKICVENGTNSQYAVKCIDGAKLHKEDVEGLKTELSLLRQLQHEHIIFFKDYFEDNDKNYHYVVTELLQGGELFTAIVAREKYTEVDARNTVMTIFLLHIIDDFFAAIHAEINIEIGHGYTFRIKEALKEKPKTKRVKIGNGE